MTGNMELLSLPKQPPNGHPQQASALLRDPDGQAGQEHHHRPRLKSGSEQRCYENVGQRCGGLFGRESISTNVLTSSHVLQFRRNNSPRKRSEQLRWL